MVVGPSVQHGSGSDSPVGLFIIAGKIGLTSHSLEFFLISELDCK